MRDGGRERFGLRAFALVALAAAFPAAAGTAGAGCVALSGDRILGSDLAAAAPELAGIPPSQVISFAPLPGAVRRFTPDELGRLARRYGIEATPRETVCFEVRTRPLDPARLGDALTRALEPARAAAIEVLDFSRHPVAEGPLEFPGLRAAALRPDRPDGSRLIRGAVRFGARTAQPFWVRARITLREKVVVAVADLQAHQPIPAGAVEERELTGPPLGVSAARSAGDVIGKAPRRAIRAGSVVELPGLVEPRDVQPGEAVEVEVVSGRARLELTSRARTGGRTGDTILLENSETGRKYSARVTGPGRATVRVDGGRTVRPEKAP